MGKIGSASTLALLGIGAYFLFWRKGPGSVVTASNGKKIKLAANMKPAGVSAGESVAAKTYRVIANQRPGMAYAPISQGAIGAEITIGPMPRNGTWTRNVLVDPSTGALVAEIA